MLSICPENRSQGEGLPESGIISEEVPLEIGTAWDAGLCLSMRLERITVHTRDEYQGAQEPVRFWWRGEFFEVEYILDRWYEGYADATRVPLRYFRVSTRGGRQFLLRYHELFCAWALVVPREDEEE